MDAQEFLNRVNGINQTQPEAKPAGEDAAYNDTEAAQQEDFILISHDEVSSCMEGDGNQGVFAFSDAAGCAMSGGCWRK